MTTIFNPDRPVQTIVGAGLYIIPQGYFAKVSYLEGGSTLYINGIEVMPTSASTATIDTQAENTSNASNSYTEYQLGIISYNGTLEGTWTARHTCSGNGCGTTSTFTFAELLIDGTTIALATSNGDRQPATVTQSILTTVNAGKNISVKLHAMYNSDYLFGYDVNSYSSGILFNVKPLLKPVTGETVLKEGDTIEGGKYIISLYEV